MGRPFTLTTMCLVPTRAEQYSGPHPGLFSVLTTGKGSSSWKIPSIPTPSTTSAHTCICARAHTHRADSRICTFIPVFFVPPFFPHQRFASYLHMNNNIHIYQYLVCYVYAWIYLLLKPALLPGNVRFLFLSSCLQWILAKPYPKFSLSYLFLYFQCHPLSHASPLPLNDGSHHFASQIWHYHSRGRCIFLC